MRTTHSSQRRVVRLLVQSCIAIRSHFSRATVIGFFCCCLPCSAGNALLVVACDAEPHLTHAAQTTEGALHQRSNQKAIPRGWIQIFGSVCCLHVGSADAGNTAQNLLKFSDCRLFLGPLADITLIAFRFEERLVTHNYSLVLCDCSLLITGPNRTPCRTSVRFSL